MSNRAVENLQSDFCYLTKSDSHDGPFFIREYIEDNFQKRQLFNIFNHPKSEIYLHLVNQLLEYLGFTQLPSSSLNKVSGHVEQNLPVHPALSKGLYLEFCNDGTEYDYLGNTYTFQEFTRLYLSFLR